MKRWAQRDKDVLWHPFTQQAEWCAGEPLVIASAEGVYLVDDRGRRYLDGVASLWCNVHGHDRPEITRAIATQLGAVAHSTFLGLSHPPGIELAERLVEVTGLDRVFYSDSGSTAVEIALKLAYQWGRLAGRGDRRHFLHLSQSYHGDTLGAVGVGGIEVFHRVFGGLVVPGIPVPTPYVPVSSGLDREAQLERGLAELDRVLDRHADSLAAFVVEPLVQGAAGMLTHPRGYLRAVADRCRALDLPLIVDEVATGFGRTGTLFACEQEDVSPDFLCLAKGITGGYLPLAATLTTERIYAAFLGERREMKHFFHGHTYTANPLACAAGLASLSLLLAPPSSLSPLPSEVSPNRRPDTNPDTAAAPAPLPAPAAEEGRGGGRRPDRRGDRRLGAGPDGWKGSGRLRADYAGLGDRLQRVLDREIRERRGVVEVRRIGAMVGIELGPYEWDRFVGARVCERVREHGVVLRPLGDVIVWMPPLCITEQDLELLATATAAALDQECST